MLTSTEPLVAFLQDLPGFDQLAPATLGAIAAQFRPLRYSMGRTLLTDPQLPTHFLLIYQGQVRLLGYRPSQPAPVTLKLLGPGEALGWVGLVRQVPCETAIASTDVIALTLPAAAFLQWLRQEPPLAQVYRHRPGLSEVCQLLGLDLTRRADGQTSLKELSLQAWAQSKIAILPSPSLSPEFVWFLSSGTLSDLQVGDRLPVQRLGEFSKAIAPDKPIRLLGIPEEILTVEAGTIAEVVTPEVILPWYADAIPEAPEQSATPSQDARHPKYPFVAGRGTIDGTLACLQMLADYWTVPFRRDVLRRILLNHAQTHLEPSLELCGALAELMGLRAQLLEVPLAAIAKLPTPTLALWQGQLILLYRTNGTEVVFADPEQGILHRRMARFLEGCSVPFPVLLLERTATTPQRRFGLGWFWPAVQQHRKVLMEVLIASFVVQIFSLANPLVTQIIIDKVLVQNSLDTLNVLGILLIVVAVFEGLLSSFRSYLFADTTNRIDLALGAQVIDHLLRLPLGYFDRRPVGELSSRVNELENIRQFLTGTALTVVLDAVFSGVYIVVMAIYSWLLTLVALATVPLFALLTLMVSPIVRRLARTKAERNAETQSHLVEVLSGIQTVKAQNMELKARWKWQERYARFISAGFDAVIVATTAGAMSHFLNQLSNLLLLWVGAILVLQQQLTLGELIAFRIIAGYTTSPLLRLLQLWQNFQETALSLERLADILDHPQEVSDADRDNIPMPPIQGDVRFEDLCFRFNDKSPLQLQNVHIQVKRGQFVGIVGQSGSGKSTLMKLLMRLYEPTQGHILVDGYHIGKVELYSLRRQIGMVLQDSLLFDGTIQENIALTCPEATAEDIVAAAKVAYAHEFIMTLPQGYNSRVGERGASLSGGQRQRIAIARAVLQNPRLLILDEATSALDYNAERQVCQNLAQAFANRTVFFITHRLKTLQKADHIIFLDQGKVAEEGTHAQLMALQGLYYCLYQQQETQV